MNALSQKPPGGGLRTKRKYKRLLRDRIEAALSAGHLNYLAVCQIVRLDRDLHKAQFQHNEDGITALTDRIDAIIAGAPHPKC